MNVLTVRLIALGVTLTFLAACASDPGRHIATPTIGERLSLHGSKVVATKLETNSIAAFVKQYQASNDETAYVFAQRIFRDDSLIPEEAVPLLRALLSSSKAYPSKPNLVTYSLSFRLMGQGGSRDGTLTIDWSNRLLVSETFFQTDVSGSPPRVVSTALSLSTALGHFRNHLVAEGRDVSKLQLTASKYGNQTIVFSCVELEPLMSPAPEPTRYFLDAKLQYVKIYKMDQRTIGWIIATELKPATPEERLSAIHAYIQLHDPYAQLINSVRQIPGHDKRPADPDVASAIRPVFEFVDRRTNFTFNVAVCYTYTRLGGVVTRYRFAFHEEYLDEVTPTVLCENVGDAQYLQ